MAWELIKSALESLHTSVKGAVVFTGTGTNDLTVSGSCNFATARQYVVAIDSTSETFKWSNDNGATYEQTAQTIVAGLPFKLVNAEGEDEGISIRFASRTGHVATDNWVFNTTGQVVPNTATLLGVGQCSQGAESIIFKGEYSKGTETGLQIYVVAPLSINGSVLYRPSRPQAMGAGGLLHYPEYWEFDASASFSFDWETRGNQFYKIYAVKKGGTVSGLFTLLHGKIRTKY
jgi:hypothetical protein